MKKTLYLIVSISLFLIGVIAACNLRTAPIQQPKTKTPTPTISSTKTSTLVPTAIRTATPAATATPEFAPFCEPGTALPSQCQPPFAEQSSVFCSKKVPYNLILISEGATYEVLSENISCSDAGKKDGRQMVTCTGPMASPFGLSVCNSACAAPTIEAQVTKCPQGYNYNNLDGCCTQELQVIGQNCAVLKLKTTSCVVDCGEFTKKSTCDKNSYTCIWNSENNVCQLRR